MSSRGTSIRTKLIAVSTLLLVVVIGIFGVINGVQSRRIIDESTKRLSHEMAESLRHAGLAQLELLGETVKIALVQNDYSTLQTTVENIAKRDDRVVMVAVVDRAGTIVAHQYSKSVGARADGVLQKSMAISKTTSESGVMLNGRKAMTFAAPVDQDGNRLCTVLLAFDLSHLESELVKADALKKKTTEANLKNVFIVGLLSILIGVVFTVFQGMSITRPIVALTRQANQIAGGDLQARVEVKTADEIGILGDRFNYMADQVLALMRETMQKAAMEKELEVASAVQATLVPDAATVEVGEMIIAGFFKPASQCGGDWWNYTVLKDGRVLFVVGDVTGHGVASAMITATAKGAASTMIAVAGEKIDLQSYLSALDVSIAEAAHGRFNMTCLAAIYDPKKRKLSYANAGHNFPYVHRGASGEIVPLVARGNRLGHGTGNIFESKEIDVAPQDTFILYTDGLVECENARGEEYGERRFRATIKSSAQMPADQLRDVIVQRATQFYGDVPPKDDITLVIARFK